MNNILLNGNLTLAVHNHIIPISCKDSDIIITVNKLSQLKLLLNLKKKLKNDFFKSINIKLTSTKFFLKILFFFIKK